MENPQIRPVGDLLTESFYVPRYQRGYRWGKQEITELLDDILQYHKATENREDKVSKFYCLQPVVVKKKQWQNNKNETFEGWELIDGQQRLTTILLILNYLEDIRKLLGSNLNNYTIDFETRENCKVFFEYKTYKSSIDESNVDFYHISQGYEYINEWFLKNPYKLQILNTLLKTEYNVSIIWYEAESTSLESDDSSIDLFTRLNEGKIPLTDAELIKALLLQADLYPTSEERFVKQRLFEIASEWDFIEAKLQDERMWLFFNDTSYQPSSKIEFIFKLLADKWNEFEKQSLIKFDLIDGKPKHYEFLVFSKYLAGKRIINLQNKSGEIDLMIPINDIWKEIKDIFSKFNEWYNDHNLYHYLGFLFATEKNKDELIRELINLNIEKKSFESNIKTRIGTAIKIANKVKETGFVKQLNQIAYNEDNPAIIKILLLFNIYSLIEHQKENARFPFHLFKKEKITSIEHIHPQNPLSLDTDEERAKIWLNNHKLSLNSLRSKQLEKTNEVDDSIKKIEDLLGKNEQWGKEEKETFKNIFSEIIELYTEISEFKESELHTLYNLALVDKVTNSQLNNSFFDIKGALLKENKLGRYIPFCTQRAFSKFYSNRPNDMIFWNDDDRKAYFNAIEKIYLYFTNLIINTNGN